MEIQYLLFSIIITLILFLIALGVKKTTKIFLGNYIAGFSAIISYLFIDFIVNYLDHTQNIKIDNPDILQGILVNNKTIIIISIYFIFFILFYKSKLFDIEINGILKKIFGYLFFPVLTVINLIFTMLLLINGPKALTYKGYIEIINSLEINEPLLNTFFGIIPGIIIIIPILVLLLFLDFNIKLPQIRKKKEEIKKEEKDGEEAVNSQ